ncbi:MAG: sugar transferase [Flavobacteriales bacterium]|nr:sugar transferase [Flavobacteriales bacterium]MCB9168237.1 sugar transferase [Flavobacteriales bacterium]
MKRAFDILFSATLLVLLAPGLVLLAFVVAVTSSGGAFFRQVRVGRNGRMFQLIKFRSMRPGAEAAGQITIGGADPRITSLGRFLRRSKLDELPQLWNVLIGDMSIVGPRPEVPYYVALYSPEQRRVLSVRPGLTGPASLHYIDENELLARSDDPERLYRDEILPAKLVRDLAYVDHHDLGVDLRIIGTTIGRVFLRRAK